MSWKMSKRSKNRIFFLVLFTLTCFTVGYPKARAEKKAGVEVGIFGDTWEIAEPDQAEVFKKHALKNRKKIEQAYAEMQKKVPEKIRALIAKLPPATEYKRVLLKTNFTLDHDIFFPGKDGRWYYFPAGYTFNPFNYIQGFEGMRYAVINPKRKKEIELVKSKEGIIKVLLSDFPNQKLPEGFSYAFLSKEMAEKLKLEGTPAFISFSKEGLEIEYVPVKDQ